MAHIEFSVRGVPVPQGSMSAFLRGDKINVTDQKGTKLKGWRYAVMRDARNAAGARWVTLQGPVGVEIVFGVKKPTREPKRRRTWPVRRGSDIDKLVRAVLDSLDDARIYHDDAQVISVKASKDWPENLGMDSPGARIRVWSIEG